jgi:hypothetical protein
MGRLSLRLASDNSHLARPQCVRQSSHHNTHEGLAERAVHVIRRIVCDRLNMKRPREDIAVALIQQKPRRCGATQAKPAPLRLRHFDREPARFRFARGKGKQHHIVAFEVQRNDNAGGTCLASMLFSPVTLSCPKKVVTDNKSSPRPVNRHDPSHPRCYRPERANPRANRPVSFRV